MLDLLGGPKRQSERLCGPSITSTCSRVSSAYWDEADAREIHHPTRFYLMPEDSFSDLGNLTQISTKPVQMCSGVTGREIVVGGSVVPPAAILTDFLGTERITSSVGPSMSVKHII